MTGPVSVSVRLLATTATALLLVFLLASCGGDEEVAPAPSSTPPTTPLAVTPTPSADGPLGSPTVIPPLATPSADITIPADWLTFSNPDGRYTVQYPPTWYAEDGHFSTFKLGSTSPFPGDAIKVDVSYASESQLGGCPKDPQAVQVEIAGQPAWLIVKNYQHPVITRSYQAWLSHNGLCYGVLALFSQQQPDDDLIMKFVSSFRLGK